MRAQLVAIRVEDKRRVRQQALARAPPVGTGMIIGCAFASSHQQRATQLEQELRRFLPGAIFHFKIIHSKKADFALSDKIIMDHCQTLVMHNPGKTLMMVNVNSHVHSLPKIVAIPNTLTRHPIVADLKSLMFAVPCSRQGCETVARLRISVLRNRSLSSALQDVTKIMNVAWVDAFKN